MKLTQNIPKLSKLADSSPELELERKPQSSPSFGIRFCLFTFPITFNSLWRGKMLSKAPFFAFFLFSIHPLPPQIFLTKKAGWGGGGALYAYWYRRAPKLGWCFCVASQLQRVSHSLEDAWLGGMCARHRSLRVNAEQQLTLTAKWWKIVQICCEI